MLFPKYVLEDLSVGSSSIIGKDNIEEFFNHISMHQEVEEKSLVELAPSIEIASAYLIHMLEARKVLKHFSKLSSPIKVICTNDEGTKIPIRSKLLGLYEAFENNFNWICPENLFSDLSEPKRDHKGSSKLMWMKYNALLTRPLLLILMPLLKLLDSQFSAPSSKALKKSTLGRKPNVLFSVLFLLFESWKSLLL
jgi:hypothetical protein